MQIVPQAVDLLAVTVVDTYFPYSSHKHTLSSILQETIKVQMTYESLNFPQQWNFNSYIVSRSSWRLF